MTEETIHERDATLVRRLRLEPGEATRWHRDSCHRVSVVLGGNALSIEYRDGAPADRFELRAGQVGWDEPMSRIHRGVNTGSEPYEEVTVFFLDQPGADPQPSEA